MRKFGYIPITIRELEGTAQDKREEILNACLASQEYKRGGRNVRIAGCVGFVLTTGFLVALRWVVPGWTAPLSKWAALICAIIPVLAFLVFCIFLPIYLDVRRLKALANKKVNEINR